MGKQKAYYCCLVEYRSRASGYGSCHMWTFVVETFMAETFMQSALHLSSNPIFHERPKHIKVHCHFIRDNILSGIIRTSFVDCKDQLDDILTKPL